MNVASAGDFDIAVSAGSGTFTVPDGQTLTLGKASHNSIVVSPHGTAGSELMLIQNVAGTTDGAAQAGAIELDAQAGGIGLAWADGKDLWAEGGRAVVTANEDAADCIKLHADAGTSQTITVVNDAGTSVTEGSAAVQLLSTAGGVGVRSAANLAKAVNITSDGGTTGSIAIFNDQGTSVTEGAESISILSDAGGVGLRSTANLANAINLTVDGGTTSTMTLFNDQGTSVTEGAESIAILSDAGGVGIRSTADLANAVNITVDGGTSSTMTLFNDQGTSATEGAASIQLLSDVGGINVKSNLDAASAILLTADGGTSATMVMHNDQGTAATSLNLLSDAGGITLSAGNTSHGVKVGDISGAPVTIGHTTSETTVSDNLTVTGNAAITGTLTGYKVEMFYPAISPDHADAGFYSVSAQIKDSGSTRAGGRAPEGFQSVSDCTITLMRTGSGNNSTGIQVGWASNAHHAARDGNTQTHTTVPSLANSNIPTADDVYIGTFFNMLDTDPGTDFEDEVVAGDAFTFSVKNTGSDDVTIFGCTVTWVF